MPQKTECQFLGEGSKKFRLEVEGQELEQTENFVYLGGNISTQEGSDKDVERRIGLARGTWQALGKVWNSKELSKATKTRMYEVLVLSTLLYNAETWTLREKQKQRLRVFKMACLQKRGNHEKRQDKKRRNIQETRYQNRNNRQNTIVWTSESDEEQMIPQNSIQRLYTWSQKEGKAKETMDRHDQRGLQRIRSEE